MSELTITEFLEARIAEDEAAALACGSATWRIISEDGTRHPLWVEGLSIAAADSTWDACIAVADAEHATRHDPARVLAECAAKRAVIKSAKRLEAKREDGDWQITEDEDILEALAAVYSDHPDYQQDWAV